MIVLNTVKSSAFVVAQFSWDSWVRLIHEITSSTINKLGLKRINYICWYKSLHEMKSPGTCKIVAIHENCLPRILMIPQYSKNLTESV